MFLLKNFSVNLDSRNTLGLNVSILFLTSPMLQTLDLERSDQNCQFLVQQLTFCTKNAYARRLAGGAFSIHQRNGESRTIRLLYKRL